MDKTIRKIDFIKYSPSSLATINNSNSYISIIFPREDIYLNKNIIKKDVLHHLSVLGVVDESGFVYNTM